MPTAFSAHQHATNFLVNVGAQWARYAAQNTD